MSTLTTIQGLIDALGNCEPTAAVYIDNRPPTALSSYRGYYDELAIERSEHGKWEATEIDDPVDGFDIDLPGFGWYQPGSHQVAIRQPPTAADLIEALGLSLGATFEGYKGGQFTMDEGTRLWVSEHGQCDQLEVAAVEEHPGRVDLLTREVEW